VDASCKTGGVLSPHPRRGSKQRWRPGRGVGAPTKTGATETGTTKTGTTKTGTAETGTTEAGTTEVGAPVVRLELPADADLETQKLFRAFVRSGRISTLPAKYTRRRMLLDHVARLFEPGVRYDEPTVNAILLQVYADWAELRRALVDEDFLSRDRSVYWRSGGTVEI
jgi:hypothetical protein